MGCAEMILLDTHALIWLDKGSNQLGSQSINLANEALAQNMLFVSSISFWETAMLVSRGRISLSDEMETWRQELFSCGLGEIPLDGNIAVRAVRLSNFHADPADRFIVATSQWLDATLITADQKILDWPGNLRRHPAKK